MNKARKEMPQELKTLKKRMKALLRANMGEVRRTMELLRDTERKVEDRFALIDSLETAWEKAGRKFRKKPIQDIAPWPQSPELSMQQRSAPVPGRSDANSAG